MAGTVSASCDLDRCWRAVTERMDQAALWGNRKISQACGALPTRVTEAASSLFRQCTAFYQGNHNQGARAILRASAVYGLYQACRVVMVLTFGSVGFSMIGTIAAAVGTIYLTRKLLLPENNSTEVARAYCAMWGLAYLSLSVTELICGGLSEIGAIATIAGSLCLQVKLWNDERAGQRAGQAAADAAPHNARQG